MKTIHNNGVKGLLSCVMVLVLLLTLCGNIPAAQAASYSGKGTMTDPYIVTNAQQLQDMRENLSAHYKLGNTIDLTGVDFKPIGRLDGKFTGSFICELNADGTPKYVIKNLKIQVAETAYGSEGKNKWEAALFGATDGATLMGIYVLDAYISNNNFGDNQGSVVYNNYKPGMDEMNSAILIGDATSTTVTNCATTGLVDTSANHCGGLIGSADSCTIDNCYSTANVFTKGYWNVGGLIGGTSNCTITSCFATGEVKGGQTNICSFIGATGGSDTITDCYATGNATGVKEDASTFTTFRGANGVTVKNCFATGALAATVTKNTEGKYTVENCYNLAGKLGDTSGFADADMATIKSKLTGANWDTTGDMPRLVNIGIVSDSSAYQPQSNPGGTTAPDNAGPDASAPDQTAPEGTLPGNSDGNAAGDESAQLIEKIEALPDPEAEGAVTLDCKAAVVEAYAAYDKLSVSQKDDFDAKLASKLLSLRSKLSIILAGDVVKRTMALPEVDALTGEEKQAVLELWADFTFLEESTVAEFDAAVIEKLEAAYAWAQEAEDTGSSTVIQVNEGLTTFELVIVILCGVVFLAAIAVDVVAGIVLLKKIRKCDEDRSEKIG